jgi:hypothetical protein
MLNELLQHFDVGECGQVRETDDFTRRGAERMRGVVPPIYAGQHLLYGIVTKDSYT